MDETPNGYYGKTKIDGQDIFFVVSPPFLITKIWEYSILKKILFGDTVTREECELNGVPYCQI